jgi:MFS family permease
MAGGTSIWASKDAKTDPKEIFNGRLLYLLITVAFGLIDLSQEEMDDRKGTIAAMLAAGGSLGALLAAPTSDYLGRKWSVFSWGIVFLIGATLQMIANYHVLLTGRFIGGMGVGASSMLSPQFLAENSPKSVRGSMTATYNLMIVTSLMLAFWVNYGVSLWTHPGVTHEDAQWRTSIGE